MKKKSNKTIKYRLYAQLALSDVWQKMLKPDLIRIRDEWALSDGDAKNQFDAVKRDIQRTTSINNINRIIALIERADSKVSRSDYGNIQSNDE